MARLTGLLLVLIAVAAIYAEALVRGTLIVAGDANATMGAMAQAPLLFRSGFVAYLLAFILDVPVAILLHRLLRHAGEITSQVGMALRLVYVAVVCAALLGYLGAIVAAEAPSPSSDAVMFGLALFARGFTTSLVIFGVHLGIVGALLFRSRLVPRALGVAVALGGVSYVVGGVLSVLQPPMQQAIAPVLAVLAMSELVLAFWLLIRGSPSLAVSPAGS